MPSYFSTLSTLSDLTPAQLFVSDRFSSLLLVKNCLNIHQQKGRSVLDQRAWLWKTTRVRSDANPTSGNPVWNPRSTASAGWISTSSEIWTSKKMRNVWVCSCWVTWLLGAFVPQRVGASHLRGKDTLHRVDKVYVTTQLERRGTNTCPTNFSLCDASNNGGCCPDRYSCAADSCVATTAATTSACGRQAYHACGLSDNGRFRLEPHADASCLTCCRWLLSRRFVRRSQRYRAWSLVTSLWTLLN